METQTKLDDDQESKARWEFIEKISLEVDHWADWKKAEISPSKFQQHKFSKTNDEIQTTEI